MRSDNVVIKNSSIEGKGVFALRDFKKGEIVLHWDISHTLPKEKVKQMTDKEKKIFLF